MRSDHHVVATSGRVRIDLGEPAYHLSQTIIDHETEWF
jgi:hypothetical protein